MKPFTDRDARINNQPVAKEGVLIYTTGGALKQWDDLKQNIGRTVPILDEHPSVDNGNGGLYSGNEKVWGWAKLKQMGDTRRIFADLMLYEGAPVKKGYSVGFWYLQVKQDGEFAGQKYNIVQAFITVDHLALTTMPRDPTALLLAPDKAKAILGDSWEASTNGLPASTGGYINAIVGYDSMMLSDPRLAEIRESVAKENPDMPEEELDALVSQMRANELELEAKKKSKKTTGDKKLADTDTSDEIKVLAAERDALKQELVAMKAAAEADAEKRDLKEKLAAKAKEAEELKAALDAKEAAELQARVTSMIDSIVKSHGVDAKILDGKSIEHIEGWVAACKFLSPGPVEGTPIVKPSGDSAGLDGVVEGNKYKTTYLRLSFDAEHAEGGVPTLRDPEGNPVGHEYPAGHVFKKWGEV